MYMPTLQNYDVRLEELYQRGWDVAEAIEDRRAIIGRQTVAEAAGLSWQASDALHGLSWLLDEARHDAVALGWCANMALEEFEALCHASDNVRAADLAELATALDDYLTNFYGD